MKPIFAVAAIAMTIGFPGMPDRTHAAAVADFQARSFKVSASKSIPYRLFVPKNYAAGRKYPVMLALHGGGERGTNNTSQLLHVFTNFWADDSIQKDNPCFVVAPQCPLNEQWVKSATFGNYDFTKTPITDNLQAAMNILDSLEKEFNIDADREYVSGMSLGGAGTWYTITKFPDRFAAAIPVCGGGDPAMAKVLDRVPTWTFHEVDDPTVPVHFTQDLVKAIRAVGGDNLTYTEYPASMGFGHESWKPAAKNPQLHRWLFQQTRATTSMIPPPSDRKAGHSESMVGKGFPADANLIDGLGRTREDAATLRYFRNPPGRKAEVPAR